MPRPLDVVGARVTAVGALLISVALLVRLPLVWSAASYLGVLQVVLATVGLFAAWRLWYGGHLDGRLAAGVLACLALIGQLLNATLGLPGASTLQRPIAGWGALGVAFEVLLLAALAWAGVRRTRR